MSATRHLMLDIETFGTTPGSIIDQIGYAMFTETEIFQTGFVELPVAPAVSSGFTHSWRTDQWRDQNGLNTIAQAIELTDENTWEDLCQSLRVFWRTYETYKPDWVWQKGEMDIKLINVYLSRCLGISSGLCEYWRINDVRTFLRAYNYEPVKRNTHNAEQDAINQSESLIYCWHNNGSSYPKPHT